MREVRVRSEIRALREERQQMIEQQDALKSQVQQAEASVAEVKDQLAGQPIQVGSIAASPQVQIAALESRIRALQSAPQRRATGPIVPEYDPTNPQAQPTLSEPQLEAQTNAIPMRQWGTEQALGAPNTDRAGDIPTAWATREPDAGPEWLSVGFESAVELAEVRIRETFNPGAISKVTAIENGREVVLWEGTAAGGAAPRDFVLPISGNIRSDSVVIHLDTSRVAGWNEIDAVELVGRDGSRQWAASATASSTYAEGRQGQAQPQPAGGF
jgi:hypothetical protein